MEKWKFAEVTPSGSLEYSKFNGSDNYENGGRLLVVEGDGRFLLIDKKGVASRSKQGLMSFKKW